MAQYDGSVLINTGINTKNLNKDASAVIASLQKLADRAAKISDDIASGLNRSLSTSTLEEEISRVEQKIAELEQKHKELGDTSIPTTEYTELSAEVTKAYTNLQKLLDRQDKLKMLGVSKNSAQWKSLQYDIDAASKKYAELEAARDKLYAAGASHIAGTETEEYKALSGAIEEARSRLAALQQQQAQNQAAAPGMTSNARSTAVWLNNAKSSAAKLSKNLKSGADHTAKMHGLSKSMDRNFKKLATSAKRIAIGILGAESVFALFRKAVSSYIEKHQELSDKLNAAWEGLGNLLGPIIEKAINLLATGIAYVTRFLQLLGLSGKATSNQLDKAQSSAKKLKKSLAGFDELNILNNKSESSGTSADTSGKQDLQNFETPAWMQTAAEILKAISDYIPVIAAGLSGLTLGSFIADLVTANTKVDTLKEGIKLLGKKALLTVGVTLAITGIVTEGMAIADIVKNALNLENFKEILKGGGEITIAGGAIGAALGNAVLGAGVGAIIAGIPMYITGIYDAIMNGLNWLNALLIPAGSTLASAGIGAIIGAVGGGPIGAGIGALIGLVIGAITDLGILVYQKWDEICAFFAPAAEWFNVNIIQPVSTFFSGLWEDISGWAGDCWNSICEFFQPAVRWFSELFGSVKQTLDDIFYNIGVIASGCWEVITLAWGAASSWFNEHVAQPVSKFFSGMWDGLKQGAIQAWEGVKSAFSTVGKFFSDTFRSAWKKVVEVFSPLGQVFVQIKDGVLSAFKSVVNGLITGINAVVAVPFNGINDALNWIKGINILGATPFAELRTINVPQIPYLAKGAVIPPNAPFAAVLGDQKHGTNIEAPLDTIKQAVAEVLGDFISSNVAGHEATVAVLRDILAAVLSLDLGEEALAGKVNDYNRKMEIVRGRV